MARPVAAATPSLMSMQPQNSPYGPHWLCRRSASHPGSNEENSFFTNASSRAAPSDAETPSDARDPRVLPPPHPSAATPATATTPAKHTRPTALPHALPDAPSARVPEDTSSGASSSRIVLLAVSNAFRVHAPKATRLPKAFSL